MLGPGAGRHHRARGGPLGHLEAREAFPAGRGLERRPLGHPDPGRPLDGRQARIAHEGPLREEPEAGATEVGQGLEEGADGFQRLDALVHLVVDGRGHVVCPALESEAEPLLLLLPDEGEQGEGDGDAETRRQRSGEVPVKPRLPSSQSHLPGKYMEPVSRGARRRRPGEQDVPVMAPSPADRLWREN